MYTFVHNHPGAGVSAAQAALSRAYKDTVLPLATGGDTLRRMRYATHLMHYPEGDELEIPHGLSFGDLVGLNGEVLSPPLPTERMIVYRVRSIRTDEERNRDVRHYYLEQVFPGELRDYV